MPAAPLLSHPNVLLALPFCPRGYRGHPSPPTAGRVPDMRSDIAARVLSPVASPFQAARTFHVDAAVLPNLFDALVEVPRVCCCSGSTSIHSSTTVLLVVVVVLVLVSHSSSSGMAPTPLGATSARMCDMMCGMQSKGAGLFSRSLLLEVKEECYIPQKVCGMHNKFVANVV
jgi:hypothetical protein